MKRDARQKSSPFLRKSLLFCRASLFIFGRLLYVTALVWVQAELKYFQLGLASDLFCSARKLENGYILPLVFFFPYFPLHFHSIFGFLWGEKYFFNLKWTPRKKIRRKKAIYQKKSARFQPSAQLGSTRLGNFSSKTSLLYTPQPKSC